MKRILIEAVCFFSALSFIFCFCIECSKAAEKRIDALEELLAETPEADEYALLSGGGRDRIKAFAARIKAETEKAGETLAFFNHYDTVNQALRAASDFAASMQGDEVSDYAKARASLLEALESLRRINAFSLELFL